jgi:putative ABC transport system permease protein
MTEQHEHSPPKLFLRFFRWYCHPDYLEDLEGDLIERFESQTALQSTKSAKWKFTKDVLRLFRPGIIKPITQTQQLIQLDMFKNYYKIAWRHILKEKFYSFINIAGLGVGLACCMLIALYVQYEMSFDKYNENLTNTYRVLQYNEPIQSGHDVQPAPEEYQVWGCAPVGPALMADFPEIERVFQFSSPNDWLFAYEDKSFTESNIVFADSTAFDVFSWKILAGNGATALDRPNTIVLTERLATKYFGSEDPIGKTIVADQNHLFEVTAVMEDVPSNSHFTFDGLISMGTFRQFRPGIFDSWGYVDFYTYFIINKSANIEALSERLPEFAKKYTGHWENYEFKMAFEPMADAYLNSKAGRQPGEVGSLTNLYIFILIGLFILIIACINFINLSTARSIERAKEVGIRKVVGARKQALVYQFLSEFFLLSIFAGILAIGLVILFAPALQGITGKPIDYTALFTLEYAGIFLLTLSVIGLLSGSYPAFMLSAFRPVEVLKGKFRSSTNGIALRKGLVTFQFMLTIVLLVGTAAVYLQLNYMQNQDLGFSQEQMLIVEFGYDDQVQNKLESIKEAFKSNSAVISATASRAVPGDFLPNAGTSIENTEGIMTNKNPGIYEIDPDFIQDYKIEMVAGRPFSYAYASDSLDALILNEAAARMWGYSNPADIIGKPFDQWGKQGKVVGVVKDFNYQSLHTGVEPLSLRFEPQSMSKISIRIQSDNYQRTISQLEDQWKILAPHYPFNYRFLDDSFNKQYKSDAQFGDLFSAFAILAIFIACLGLFGLTTYTTTQRTKEIGIRKVLGASVSTIVLLLSKEFSKLLILAFIVAIPASWFAIQVWLDKFAYKIDLGAGIYIVAAITVAIIALATMSWQSIKVALQNPVNSLKNE